MSIVERALNLENSQMKTHITVPQILFDEICDVAVQISAPQTIFNGFLKPRLMKSVMLLCMQMNAPPTLFNRFQNSRNVHR